MDDKIKELVDDYNSFFVPNSQQYSTPELQASQFKIVSVLKNVETSESMNSVLCSQHE